MVLRRWGARGSQVVTRGLLGPVGGEARPLHYSFRETGEGGWSTVAVVKSRVVTIKVTYLRPEQVLRLTVDPEKPCTRPW